MAKEYLVSSDVVLELGGRYGTVSCVIDKILDNKRNLVVIEPDSRVWKSLELNKLNHESDFHIIKGAISNSNVKIRGSGYGSMTTYNKSSNVPIFTLQNIYELTGISKFTALVVDCEGCFLNFINENINILPDVRIILLESDKIFNCNYNKVNKILKTNNFLRIKKDGQYSVWINQSLIS
jgi:FkbM family methyltransferase